MNPSDKSNAYVSAPTIGRSKRCQNCIHFDNGEPARQVYFVKRSRELEFKARKRLETAGVSLRGKSFDAKRALKLIEASDEGMIRLKRGTMGLCAKDAHDGDFVDYLALCDQWVARVVPDGVEKGDVVSAHTRAAVFGASDEEQTQGAALRPKDRDPDTISRTRVGDGEAN